MNDEIFSRYSLKEKIDILGEDLRELAVEIIDDLDLQHELENHYVVDISKELYDKYVNLLKEQNKLRSQL